MVPLSFIYGFRGVLGIPKCTYSHSKDKLALVELLLLLYVHLIDQRGFIVHETMISFRLKPKDKFILGSIVLTALQRGVRCIAAKTVAMFEYLTGFLEARRCHKPINPQIPYMSRQ